MARQTSRVRRYKAFRGHGDARLGVFLGYVSAANPDDAFTAARLSWGLPVVVRRNVGSKGSNVDRGGVDLTNKGGLN